MLQQNKIKLLQKLAKVCKCLEIPAPLQHQCAYFIVAANDVTLHKKAAYAPLLQRILWRCCKFANLSKFL